MKKTTIVDVMAGEGISVPAVQRDYVMGRPEAHEKLKKSLELFLEAIFDGKIDPLYFVYGIKKGEAGPLMLLDGQQRLTTLVLVVWFCDESLSVVGNWKFTYEMRRAARYFMENLVKTPCTNHEKPWENIKSSDWFLPDMDLDATVSGIHKALDLLGKLYRTRYASRNVLPIANLELALKRIPFSLEEMKDLGVDEHSYDQIFLKMNARGLPLSPWEKMKSVLDRYGDQEWKDNIDGIWAEKVWDVIASDDVESCDHAMLKIVRLAALSVDSEKRQGTSEEKSPVLKNDMSPDQLDIWMRDNDRAIRFFDVCKNYFIHVVNSDFRKSWGCDRAKNFLWDEGNATDKEFCEFLVSGNITPILRLRFGLMCSKEFDKSKFRTRRILLNLIDRLDHIDGQDVLKFSKIFKFFLRDADPRQLAENLHGQRENGAMLRAQLKQELIKLRFDEKDVINLEKDTLVYRAHIDFLLWGEVPNSFLELEGRLNWVHRKISQDWIGLFCAIVNNMEYSDVERTYLRDLRNSYCRLPYEDEKCWGAELFENLSFCSAFIRLKTAPLNQTYPPWLLHLRELLESGESIGRAIKYSDNWMYVIGETNCVEGSIRLDRSLTERKNRLALLPNGVRILKKSYDQWELSKLEKGRPLSASPGKDVFYDVKADSWWQGKEVPCPIFSEVGKLSE